MAPWYQYLAPALLHTLWQGLVIGVLLFATLRLLPARQTRLRYALSLAALGLVVVGWMVTWSWLAYEPLAAHDISHAATDSPYAGAPAPPPFAPFAEGSANGAPAGRSSPPAASRESSLRAIVGQSWRQLFVWCWLAGVGLMTARIGLLVHAQLHGRSRFESGDERITGEVNRLARLLGVTRRVRVATVAHLASPAVYGIVYPTILLPLAVIGETSLDQLRFILAHELAHIRRYDYLVNLAQMAIEALLFFNPAVWWISRQIRLEREACCDALAVRATGDAAGYARTLVDWSARLREVPRPRAAAAFAESGRPTQLRERVSRLLLPGYRPALRVSPSGLVGLLAVGGLALAGLFKGTGMAVAVAAEIMSPEERIERIQAVEEKFAAQLPPKGGKVEISGTIKTEDGGPLARRPTVHSLVLNQSSSTGRSVAVEDGHFHGTVGGGRLWVWAQQPGYAIALAGPIDATPESPPEPFELVLTRGYTAQLLVADPDGKPIPGARLRANLVVPARASSQTHLQLGKGETDAFGQCALEHVTAPKDTAAQIYITARGFQEVMGEPIELDPEGVTSVELLPARPTSGTVVHAADGTPAAGAQLVLKWMTRQTPHGTHSYGGDAEPKAVCDDEGRFVLDTLADGATHDLVVRGTDGSRAKIADVKAGQTGLRVELPPPLVVRGKVLAVERLGRRRRLNYTNKDQGSGDIDLDIRDGVGYFEITGLLATRLHVWGGGGNWNFDLSGKLDELVIDLAAPQPSVPKRKVIFQLETPPGSPEAAGSIRVGGVPVAVRDNRAEFEVGAPQSVLYSCGGLTGYWFPYRIVNVEAGQEPLVVRIPVRPAGSIYGHVAWPAAKDEPEVRYSVFEVDRPAGLASGESFTYGDSVHVNGAERTYVVAPIPLDGTYLVMARQGAMVVLSQPVRLDARSPVREINFERPETVAVRGTVTDDGGRPIRGASVSLDCRFNPTPQSSHSTGVTGTGTDRNGAFALEEIGLDLRIAYSLIVRRDGFQPAWIRDLVLDDQPLDIQLEKGHTLRGVVLNDATGEPESGARLAINPENIPHQLPQSVETNARGEFELDTLPAGDVSVQFLGQVFHATTDGDEPIELRVHNPAPTPR